MGVREPSGSRGIDMGQNKRTDIVLKGDDAKKFEELKRTLSKRFGFQMNNIATHQWLMNQAQ